MNSEEYIDILNADGSPSGSSCLKSEIHAQGYYHNTAHVWFYSTDGKIVLAQRAASKIICPLLWDVSVAGHVDAGEIIEEAAIRETKEEIGLTITPSELEKIGVYNCFQSYPNGIQDNEFHHTFITELKQNLETLKLDKNEVAQVKFVTFAEFRSLLQNSDHNGHFVSSNTPYYLDVLEAIETRIEKNVS